jgi:hypothetical protein
MYSDTLQIQPTLKSSTETLREMLADVNIPVVALEDLTLQMEVGAIGKHINEEFNIGYVAIGTPYGILSLAFSLIGYDGTDVIIPNYRGAFEKYPVINWNIIGSVDLNFSLTNPNLNLGHRLAAHILDEGKENE